MKLEIFRQETNGKAQIQDGNAKVFGWKKLSLALKSNYKV